MTPLLLLSLPIVSYEPEIVQLTGTLQERVCPGPPEYASIENGDEPEHIFVLLLDTPIHVEEVSPQDDSLNEPEDNVIKIQIAASPEDAQHLVGKQVTITGTLFHAHTAHHRTKVLMIDNNIEYSK